MFTIDDLAAHEILDSRGRPTVKASLLLSSGHSGTVSVPSGASTGIHEAHELRDGDPQRYRGKGCLKAVNSVRHIRAEAASRPWRSQQELDNFLIDLDGTPNKSRLGANAVLAVSLAFARAVAGAKGQSLWRHFASLRTDGASMPAQLPSPTINLFSGGVHAGKQVALQDVLVLPLPARPIDEQMAAMAEVYACAVDLIARDYGQRNLTADEGGLAPPFKNTHEMLAQADSCCRAAGLEPGIDYRLAIDAAASHFHVDGRYHVDGKDLSAGELVSLYRIWCRDYPMHSIEDGLAEDDWTGWQELCAELGDSTIVLGDDLLCTNPNRIRRAAGSACANALLLKVNQIGTLSEAQDALELARGYGWHVVASARSGETEDDWLADLAVGWQADNIKVGSITQSERLAKYNRLLYLGNHKPFGSGAGRLA
ncbi:MAG: enolase [Caldilineaceae bacterium]|nr:enolase [Caldilineaceae bacterium]